MIAITGCGVVAAPAAIGREAFAAALANGAQPPGGERQSPVETPYVLPDFDPRAHLGRKGTSLLNRGTGLALIACREALDDSGLAVEPDRVGVNLGTTTGSLRSMSDYTRDTLVEERPYLVNPGLFPNTVMNCVSGYAAIRHGLRGVNSTIAAGQIACFGVLGSAARALRLGYLDATLAGAVEEFSEQRAWQSQLARANGAELPVGEGVAVFVVERAQDARSAGRHVDAEIESVVTGFCPGGEPGGGLAAALERTVARALDRASAQASDIALAACSPPPDSADPGLGRRVGESAGDAAWEWVDLAPLIGECGAATSALQIAALLIRHRTDEGLDGRRSLAFSWTAEGAVAAAVLRGHRRREASP